MCDVGLEKALDDKPCVFCLHWTLFLCFLLVASGDGFLIIFLPTLPTFLTYYFILLSSSEVFYLEGILLSRHTSQHNLVQ